MIFNKNKAFNLVEILLSLMIVSILAIGFLPVLTKRAHRSSDPDCVNGHKTIQEIVTESTDKFEISGQLASAVKVTLIGAGQSGASPVISENNTMVSTDECKLEPNASGFYTNVMFSAIKSAQSADCDNSKAGASGDYIDNLPIQTEKDVTYSYDVSNFSTTGFTISNSWNPGIVGASATSTYRPAILQGGVPPVSIILEKPTRVIGIGGSCKLNGDSYVGLDSALNYGACKLTYKTATQGIGGQSGEYAKIYISKVMSGVTCNITIGKGGTIKDDEDEETLGANTSISCDNNVKYTVLGGGQTSEISDNTGFSLISSTQRQNASSLDSTKISGGKGGDVKIDDTTIYSNGGVGGCDGAETSFQCQNPNGAIGTKGSGGGGGSCNEQTCGIGGKGGDGLVIIEYQVQCR